MKKIISILVLFLGLFIMTSCGKEEKTTIMVPNGTPFMGLGNLIDNKDLDIENVMGADPLTSALSKGEKDIVIAPITAGSKLYINGLSKYQLDSVITTNNTYIVSRKSTTLSSMSDLEGQEILAYGQNNTPDIVLKKALSLEDVNATISYDSDVASVAARFITDTNNPDNVNENTPKYILIVEPSLTQLKVNYNMELNVLDVSKALASEITIVPQAGIFVNPKADEDRVNKALKLIKENIKYMNENPEEYASKIVKKSRVFEVLTEEVIKQSIPQSNIGYTKAKDMKTNMNAYYSMLNEYNNKILGGKTPNEDFYR